jgi:hypothetical protein
MFIFHSRGAYFTNFCRFGWVNASYIYGLTKITLHMKRALGTLTPWKDFERATQTQTIFESSTTPEEDEIKIPIIEDPIVED